MAPDTIAINTQIIPRLSRPKRLRVLCRHWLTLQETIVDFSVDASLSDIFNGLAAQRPGYTFVESWEV